MSRGKPSLLDRSVTAAGRHTVAHGPDPGGGLSSYSPHAKKTVAEGRVALAFAACALAVPWRELSLRASTGRHAPRL